MSVVLNNEFIYVFLLDFFLLQLMTPILFTHCDFRHHFLADSIRHYMYYVPMLSSESVITQNVFLLRSNKAWYTSDLYARHADARKIHGCMWGTSKSEKYIKKNILCWFNIFLIHWHAFTRTPAAHAPEQTACYRVLHKQIWRTPSWR